MLKQKAMIPRLLWQTVRHTATRKLPDMPTKIEATHVRQEKVLHGTNPTSCYEVAFFVTVK